MLPLIALVFTLHAAPADSLVGRWQIKGDVMGNPVNEFCTFSQADSVLTGKCAENDNDEAMLIAGEVKDGKITFWHGGEWDGQELTIVYSGTMSAPDVLKGTIEVRPMNVAGTFTMIPAPVPDATPAKKP
jgi:hypothetical protein